MYGFGTLDEMTRKLDPWQSWESFMIQRMQVWHVYTLYDNPTIQQQQKRGNDVVFEELVILLEYFDD